MAIRELNCGIYCFDGEWLWSHIDDIPLKLIIELVEEMLQLSVAFITGVDLAADADATTDGLFFAGDRAYVVTDLFNAIMARMGGDQTEETFEDVEPVTVISFEFSPVVAVAP